MFHKKSCVILNVYRVKVSYFVFRQTTSLGLENANTFVTKVYAAGSISHLVDLSSVCQSVVWNCVSMLSLCFLSSAVIKY